MQKPIFFLNKKYISLIILSALLLPLISPLFFAISAGQIGASKICCCIVSDNWAGVAYSNQYVTYFWFIPITHISPILSTFETIYVGNLSLQYAQLTNPNSVAIWTALSPYRACKNRIVNVSNNFLQAGYELLVHSNGEITIYYSVQGYNNGGTYCIIAGCVPSGNYEWLDVFMYYIHKNNTVNVCFFVYYANGMSWHKEVNAKWDWNSYPYSALSMVESPEANGVILELPFIKGGMTNFGFTYAECGNEYAGPMQKGPNSEMLALVYNLCLPTYNNHAKAHLLTGWGNPNDDGWQYVYQFCYPVQGEIQKTCGL